MTYVRFLSLLLAVCIPAAAQVAPMLNLVVLEGEGATNNIRQRTAREPIVQVQDENHKPVAGAIVVFTLPSNGAGGTFANGARTLSMVSDNQGQAVARGFRPNGLKGQFQIRVNASFKNQTASVAITQTNAVLARIRCRHCGRRCVGQTDRRACRDRRGGCRRRGLLRHPFRRRAPQPLHPPPPPSQPALAP